MKKYSAFLLLGTAFAAAASSIKFYDVMLPSKVAINTALDSVITEFLTGTNELQLGSDVIFNRVGDTDLSISFSEPAVAKLFSLSGEYRFDDTLMPMHHISGRYVATVTKVNIVELVGALVTMRAEVKSGKPPVVTMEDAKWVKTVSLLVEASKKAKDSLSMQLSGGHRQPAPVGDQAAAA